MGKGRSRFWLEEETKHRRHGGQCMEVAVGESPWLRPPRRVWIEEGEGGGVDAGMRAWCGFFSRLCIFWALETDGQSVIVVLCSFADHAACQGNYNPGATVFRTCHYP